MALEQFPDAQNLMKHVANVQVSTPLHSQQIANFSCDSQTASDSAAYCMGQTVLMLMAQLVLFLMKRLAE
jgi:hypothetical protein